MTEERRGDGAGSKEPRRLGAQAQLRDALLEIVGGLPAGGRLPAERRLAEDLGVARMTLRRALDHLVREGRLRRVPNRGLFVTEHKLTRGLTMTSFTEEMRSQGHLPSSHTLTMTAQYAGHRLGDELAVPAEALVWRIQRLRLVDGTPLSIESVYVAQERVPGLDAGLLEDNSWYELLADRYGTAVVTGRQTIEPTVTSEEESLLLEVPLYSPAFLFERTCFDENERPVEHVRAVTRGDRYRIQCRLTAEPAVVTGRTPSPEDATVAPS